MSFLRRVLGPPKIPQGRYTYRGKDEFKGMALQLRIEPNNRGVMVINANTVLHLNETASAYSYYFMQGNSESETLKKIRRMYRVSMAKAKADYEKLAYTISTLARTEKICPVSFLEVEKEEPFTYRYSAPLRMDMALTFKCQNDCVHCYAGGPHETTELNTSEWKETIDRLSQIGVFILTFTGGEPTLREDLAELLHYSQAKGMVTGLITNGRRFKDKAYIKTLEEAGLDFAQITLEAYKPKIHDLITAAEGSWQETVVGIKNAIRSQIYVTTNTTLNKYNAPYFLRTIEYLKDLGVATFGCNSLIYSGKATDINKEFALSIEALNELLPKIRDKANQLNMKFLWYTPTQYCRFDPVESGLGVKSCTGAMINMCIGPNGDVYPCQSYFETLGNIISDKWKEIWNHPLAVRIRNREYVEPKCKDCPQLQVCGGGCPLELQSNKYICSQSG